MSPSAFVLSSFLGVRSLGANHKNLPATPICGKPNASPLRRAVVPSAVVIDPPSRTSPSPDSDAERAVFTADTPAAGGWFGEFGGQFVPEHVKGVLSELEDGFRLVKDDPSFNAELSVLLRDFVGRPSPLYFAERLTARYARGASTPQIYLKREDLNHTGAHKINNAVGQVLLAKRLGKTRVVAETGAGQHGVATATVCARFGMRCTIFMGATDIARQQLNVFRMRLLGAEVVPVTAGNATLTHAVTEAIGAWAADPAGTHFLVGSVVGPHPYPEIVRHFQSVVGAEVRQQAQAVWGGKPDVLVACVGGGSNAMALFSEFRGDEDVRLIGVEAAGKGITTSEHAATITLGEPDVMHGMKSYLLKDSNGEPMDPYSISAGLDYPGVGPEHSYMHRTGRAEYYSVTDDEALDAFKILCREEGIIPALETAHALAYLEKLCPTLQGSPNIVLNLSGRGDKDVTAVMEYLKARGDEEVLDL